MNYFCCVILITISFIFNSPQASDRHQDVTRKAERSFDKYARPPSFGYLHEGKSSGVQQKKEQGAELQLKHTMDELDLIDKGYKKGQELKKALFNSFQAAITAISSYYKNFDEDDNLEWTYEIEPIEVISGGRYVPLHIEGTVSKKTPQGIKTFKNKSLYELSRQRHKLYLISLLDFLTLSQKLLFSSTAKKSFNDLIIPTVKKIIGILTKDHSNLTLKSNIDKGYHSVIKIFLEDVKNELDKHSSNSPESEKIINACESYINSYNKLNLITLNMAKSFESIHSYEKEFKDTYTEFMKNRQFKLSPNRTITFTSHIFDFDKLLKLHTFTDQNINEHGSSNELKKKILKKGKVNPPTNPKIIETETTKDSEIQELKETEEETIDYSDPSYWAKENAYHQERKRKVQESSDNNAPQPLSEYEKKLFWFLNNYIFSHKNSPKAKELEDLLKAVKFKMEPVKGYGSVRKIYPTPDNPLFGTNENYKDAYFNVHWFADNPVVPYAYYKFIQSGFENVFGLSHEDVEKKMNPIQK